MTTKETTSQFWARIIFEEKQRKESIEAMRLITHIPKETV